MVHFCAKSIEAEHSRALTQHRLDHNHYLHGARGSAHDEKHQFIRDSLVFLPIVIDPPTGFAVLRILVWVAGVTLAFSLAISSLLR
ncbi:hypothetical protein ARMGADRAFT_1019370 [Armillaria gallica]|uniref:Uncharacterized protein n=1 Tax=Armillaria gallica TaxID=47427 RepID=A0A2H3D3Q0_ARMGA|nr:hypothetical protein ARMGADRAFT_1019370 [Armillaria gallica]